MGQLRVMARQHQIRGFSLLEMMIVLLIIGIGAATIRVAVTKKDPLEPLEKNAYEFSGWLNRLTDDVLLRNRELGLFLPKQKLA
ncbi:MAG: type II secretion system protein [Reinekea sp.]